MDFISLDNGSLDLLLAPPDATEGYYRGTRFDHAGVFRKVEMGGRSYADEWFPQYNPYRHDAVCGPSEEFGVIGFDEARPGDLFLKIGVGYLRRPDDEPYDRFRLYEIAREGKRTLAATPDALCFRQEMDVYDYRKTVRLTGADSFEIVHELSNTGSAPLQCTHYNHHFFTLESHAVGPEREIDFPFRPDGNWRSVYDNVHLTASGIRFTGPVPPEGPSVFMGDLHAPTLRSIDFSVRDRLSGLGVHAHSDEAFTHMVFWSNDRVACIEPYIILDIPPGETRRWTLRYILEKEG